MPISLRTLFFVFSSADTISMSLKTIFPSVGCSRRFMHLRNVDLPPPDGPIITTTSPFLIVVVSPFRTSSFPNDFFRPSIFSSSSLMTGIISYSTEMHDDGSRSLNTASRH